MSKHRNGLLPRTERGIIKLEYKPLQAVAYDRLLNMVQNRELEFDKIYSETKIARDFEISRTPMRDALNRLANERYIDILPNRGFQLHKSTRADVYEAYHARSAIEGYCGRILAGDAVQARAKMHVQRMQELTCAQAEMIQNSEMDLRDYWNCDLEFHRSMIDYMNVPAFAQQFNSFMHFFMAHYVKDYRKLSREHSTVEEHQRIIDALKAGDVESACRCIQFHLDQTLHITLQSLDK